MNRLSPFERVFLVFFIGSHLAVPLFVSDMFPWTAMPMFSAAPSRHVDFTVRDPSGAVLNPVELGVFRKDFANPGPRIGFDFPFSVFDAASEPDAEIVHAHVQKLLESRPGLTFVTLTRRLVGPRPDKPSAIGVIEEQTWTVERK